MVKKILCILLSGVIATALCFAVGCSGEKQPRQRITAYDLAPGEVSGLVLPFAQSADGISYALVADANIAARGEKLGRFKAAKTPEGMEYANLERFDGCTMYSVPGYSSEECFILDNGGQYLLAVRIHGAEEGQAGVTCGAEQALKEKHLLNICVRINGALYCSAAAVKLSSRGNVCEAVVEPAEIELGINGTNLRGSECGGYLFGDHPASECIILSDGSGAILFASVEYLAGNADSLMQEVGNGHQLR